LKPLAPLPTLRPLIFWPRTVASPNMGKGAHGRARSQRRRSAFAPPCELSRDRRRRRLDVVLKIIVPDVIDPFDRLFGRRHRAALAVVAQQLQALKLGERVVDLEVDVEAERVEQPLLDVPVQLFLSRRRWQRAQEIVSEKRLFALLLLGGADDVVEDTGIIVDVAEVNVVGERLLIKERLPLVFDELAQHESAERDEPAQ